MAFIQGTDFDNDIYGTTENDSIAAFGGSDFINAGAGNDELWGGTGQDSFFFHGAVSVWYDGPTAYVWSDDGFDIIGDFSTDDGDRIVSITPEADPTSIGAAYQVVSGPEFVPGDFIRLQANILFENDAFAIAPGAQLDWSQLGTIDLSQFVTIDNPVDWIVDLGQVISINNSGIFRPIAGFDGSVDSTLFLQ